MNTEEFLERKFREYYRENAYRIQPPAKMQEREFGFAYFKDRMMVRHRQFTSTVELRRFVEDSAPSDVYYSTAYYSKPEEEMDQKGWLGADLLFDIDADHIPTPCKKSHDHWICKACGRSGKGTNPQTCPSCKSERFEEHTWVCELCLKQAKNEVTKLVDFLTDDYGFSRKEMKTFFTGHRGYHLHVTSDAIIGLDSDERKEIVDYLLGNGLALDSIGILERGSTKLSLPNKLNETKGWNRRIIQKLVATIENGNEDELLNLGFKRTVMDTILGARARIVKHEDVDKLFESLDSHVVRSRSWEKIIRRVVEECSARIDTVVTTDIHRLIRAKETLNGKTGLRTVEVDIQGLQSFDPFEMAIGIKGGQETVEIEDAPEFQLEGSTFGPYKNQKVTLPVSAAVLLVSKGKACPVT